MRCEKEQQRIFIVGFVLIIFVIAWFLLKPFVFESAEKRNQREEQKISEEIIKAPSISAQDLFKKIKNGSKLFILDANSVSDFSHGHIEASINVEAGKAGAEISGLPEIQKTSDIIVVGSGDDLESVASLVNRLLDLGFVNCKYLQGGISGWRDLGYPLISSGASGGNSSKVKRISIAGISRATNPAPPARGNCARSLAEKPKTTVPKNHRSPAVITPLLEIKC